MNIKKDSSGIIVYENKRASENYIFVDFLDTKNYYPFPISGHRYDFNFEKINESEEEYKNLLVFLHKYESYFKKDSIKSFKEKNFDLTYENLKFFNELKSHKKVCRHCSKVYKSNPNPQAVIRNLKDKGFIICTLMKECSAAKKKTTFDYLLPIPPQKITSRTDKIPKYIQNEVKRLFNNKDAFSNTTDKSILPDHKFPEIRWGANPVIIDNNNLNEHEIIRKFQPLSNKYNLMKKEAYKLCYRTNKRQYPYGIKYYYSGSENWDPSIPKNGSEAEKGCFGCGWYDLITWRESLNKKIAGNN